MDSRSAIPDEGGCAAMKMEVVDEGLPRRLLMKMEVVGSLSILLPFAMVFRRKIFSSDGNEFMKNEYYVIRK
ncbi:hypothetical protein DM860_000093 [Cuscuta australis]|uniref:Uncharacterized protein n=1 Tax=Cuscuta australis TaxID=267555 RepID=A0A328CZA1_9ASTE|nr:hypothetical protein DM860_000093 [Cuscuta australis]